MVFPHDYLATIPTMPQVFDGLVERFRRIDVYTRSANFRIERPGAPIDSAREPVGGFNPFRVWPAAGRFMRPAVSLALKLRRSEYAAIIGVDPEGITLAAELNEHAGIPLVYISFELLCQLDCGNPHEELLKQREVSASRKAAVVLIQDRERGALLAADNGIDPGCFVYVPVAPYAQPVLRTDWLRRHCSIPQDKAIVLLSGSIDAWTSRDLLPEILTQWPSGFALVIHNREQTNPRLQAFLKELATSPHVYLTKEFIPQEDLPQFYASADIGFVPYLPNPSNWCSHLNTYHMGYASGKVGYLAMCGVPLLTSALPVYRREFEEFQAGECYTRISEIPEALKRIHARREFHGQEARRFFEARLNPERGIREFVEKIVTAAEQ